METKYFEAAQFFGGGFLCGAFFTHHYVDSGFSDIF